MPSTIPSSPCVRKAWLVLGSASIQLHNEAAGYYCTSLDLGDPLAGGRAVVTNRPLAHGLIDRTAYMSGRTVAADIVAITSAGALIDDIADNFAPYMDPAARPVLHYVLDRAGAPERTLTLRAAGYAAKVDSAYQRNILLQWVAADPIARDVTVNTVTTTMTTTSAHVVTAGDLVVRPLVRISAVSGTLVGGGGGLGVNVPIQHWPAGVAVNLGIIVLNPSYNVPAGTHLDIDTNMHTAFLNGDPTQPALDLLDWTNTVWPVLPLSPDYSTFHLNATDSSNTGTASIIWNDWHWL